jgi:uncharacterized membrane protein
MGALYGWLKLLHVLGAIVWMGGYVAMAFLTARLLRAGDRTVLRGYATALDAFGGPVLGASSGLTLLAGIGVAAVGHLWALLWVQLGLGLIVLLFVFGAAAIGPAARRLRAALAAAEGDGAAVAAAGGRLVALEGLYVVLLLVAVGIMVLKPV